MRDGDFFLNPATQIFGDTFHLKVSAHERSVGGYPELAAWSGVYAGSGEGLTCLDASGDSGSYI